MSWEVVQRDWQRYLGHARILWGKLAEDDLQQINGRRDVLVDMIHRKYQIPIANADEQVRVFERIYDGPDRDELKDSPKSQDVEPGIHAGLNAGS